MMAGAAALLLLAQVGDIATLGGGGGGGNNASLSRPRRLFTRASLAEYDGVRRPELYMSILGEVFDVSSKPQFYGAPAAASANKKDEGREDGGSGAEPQQQQDGGDNNDPEIGYRVFVGRDGTRAFSTGEFTLSKATDSVVGAAEEEEEEEEAGAQQQQQQQQQRQPPLEPEQLLELVEWLDFYRKNYPHKGVLAGGAFYDRAGKPRRALALVREGAAKGERAREERERRRRAAEAARPACETRWSAEEGAEVWCADGKSHPRRVQREAEEEEDVGKGGGDGQSSSSSSPGAPRQRRRAERQRRERGASAWRCVCFEEVGWSDLRQVYDGCAPDATRCKVGGGGGA
jgi:hypothetical protein